MFYLIYKITNKINNKIYIGAHKTSLIDDAYMGSGKYLLHAQRKHGIENFTKEVLFVFDSATDMYAKEAELVNDDFLAEENTYNLKRGGFGGFDYLNSLLDNPTHSTQNMKRLGKLSWEKADKDAHKKRSSERFKQLHKSSLLKGSDWTGKKHSDETKQKMRNSAIGKHHGEKNSQFGSMWITNDVANAKIKKNNVIPTGWRKGRTPISSK